MTAGAIAGSSEPPSNRIISAVSILKVNHDQDLEFVHTFLPYVGHCLAKSGAEVVGLNDVRTAMEREFGLGVPPDTLVTLLHRLEAKGLVAEDHGVYRPVHERLREWRLDEARAAMLDEHRALVVALRGFAQHGFGIEWSEREAREALGAYLDSHSASVVTAAISGRALPQVSAASTHRQEFVVHRFVAATRTRDAAQFSALEKVTKGHMLLDAMYFSGSADAAPPLAGVEVYLDGPFLMKALGLAGRELEAPTRDLLRMLADQGALSRCFEHTVQEIQDVIEAAAANAGKPLTGRHGDVVAYLLSQGESRSSLLLRARKLPHELLEKGVQPVPTSSADPSSIVDEERLEQLLEKNVSYRRKAALQRDVDSLTAVARIRRGRHHRQLAKSGAVFVTDNGGVFKAALRLLDGTRVGPAVPLCLLARPFTTLVWLQRPSSAPDLPREQLIADAFAANNPPDVFWEAYVEEIEQLKRTGNVSDDDAMFLRVSKEASEALRDVAYGEAEAVNDNAVLDALHRARMRLEAQQARAAELAEERRRLVDRVDDATRRVAIGASRFVFMLLLPAIILGTVYGPIGPVTAARSPLPEIAQVGCSVLVGGLSMFFLARGGSLQGCARFTADKLHRRLRASISRRLGLDRGGRAD